MLHNVIDSFDQSQINLIEKAIDRAWSVIKHTDDINPEAEARRVLAQCVLQQVQSGEENHTALVNHSIVSFRKQRARNAIIFRKQDKAFAKTELEQSNY